MPVGRTINSEVHKIINSTWNKQNCPKSQLLYLFIRRVIKLTVVIIHVHHFGFVNETNLVHYLLLLCFVNSIYNFYMFRTYQGPSSGGTTLFKRHLVLVILYS
jgi:hypothetical protein